jgi:phenylalanyl-tRNA synthetase beta chain
VASRSFKPLPAYPEISRDISILVPESVTHENIASLIKQLKLPNLESFDVFDVFRGTNVPEGQKSMAYALVYRSPERTLTEAEVNSAQARVVAELKSRLNAVVRE